MEATVINTNNVDPSLVFRQSLNIFNNNKVMDYLQENTNKFFNNLNASSNQFADVIRNTYSKLTDNSLISKAKNILSNSSILIKDDIVQVRNEDSIFTSGMLNRRYIMAEPTLYTMYENNRLDGWNDIWSNNEPDIEPEWRDDYLNVIDGIGIFDDDGMTVTSVSLEEDNPLTLDEQFIVKDLWETAMGLVDNGIDPTNENKGSKL